MTGEDKRSDDKTPAGSAATPDGVNSAPPGAGEGGAYPNPHKRNPHPHGGFMGHGGQGEIAYSGIGQLGEDDVEGQENVNAPAGGDSR